MRVVYVCVRTRAHYINVVLGGGVPKRFFNILPNSPHKSLSHSIDYAHKRNLIRTQMQTDIPAPTRLSPSARCFRSLYPEILLIPPPPFAAAHTYTRAHSISFSIISISLSSPLLCDKRQCRMDVPFICTHIMF